jgi:hypothetical protein
MKLHTISVMVFYTLSVSSSRRERGVEMTSEEITRMPHDTRSLRALSCRITVTIGFAALGFGAQARDAATAPQSKMHSRGKSLTDLLRPFDLTSESLPRNYAGDPFMPVYEAVVLVKPKSEFETTAEYATRSHPDVPAPLAFVVHSKPFNGVEMKYDADSETISVSVEPFTVPLGVGNARETTGYLVDRIVRDVSHGPASNAFGATVTIEKTSQDFLLLTRPTVGPLSGGVQFSFHLPRNEAERVKPSLRLLLIGSVAPVQEAPIKVKDAKANGFQLIEATLEQPFEFSTRYFSLNFDVADVWLFDERTGKVYAKRSSQPRDGQN